VRAGSIEVLFICDTSLHEHMAVGCELLISKGAVSAALLLPLKVPEAATACDSVNEVKVAIES
jgi:hypothetical protein